MSISEIITESIQNEKTQIRKTQKLSENLRNWTECKDHAN